MKPLASENITLSIALVLWLFIIGIVNSIGSIAMAESFTAAIGILLLISTLVGGSALLTMIVLGILFLYDKAKRAEDPKYQPQFSYVILKVVFWVTMISTIASFVLKKIGAT